MRSGQETSSLVTFMSVNYSDLHSRFPNRMPLHMVMVTVTRMLSIKSFEIIRT